MQTLDPPQYAVIKNTSEKDIQLVWDLVKGRLTCDPSRPKWRTKVEKAHLPKIISDTIFECQVCKHRFESLPSNCPYCGCGLFNPRKL